MSIRTKIILVLGSVVLVYLALSFAVLQAFVYPAFDDLEDKQASHNLKRIEHGIAQIADHLDKFNVEWSQWTQTRDFLRGTNEQFRARELGQFEHAYTGVDAAILFDLGGDMVWEKARDPETGRSFAVAELFGPPLRSIDRLIAHTSESSGVFGLVRTHKGPALISARSVYDSMGAGSAAGFLIYLRLLDASRLDALRQQTQVEFDLAMEARDAASSSRARKDARAPRPALDGAGEDHRLTDAWLSDIYGDRAFQLFVRTPRHITAIGSRAILLSLVSLVLGGFVVTLAVWIVLQRMIIAPIGNLTRSMLSVAKELGEAKPPNVYEEPAASARG